MAFRAQAPLRLTSYRAQTLGCRAAVAGEPVLPFVAVPQYPVSSWMKLLSGKGFNWEHLHLEVHRAFQDLGPIFRFDMGGKCTVYVMQLEDTERLMQADCRFPRRGFPQPWLSHRQQRGHKRGVFLLNGPEWFAQRMLLNPHVLAQQAVHNFLPMLDRLAREFSQILRAKVLQNTRRCLTLDMKPSLMRFAMEASSLVLFGERMNLLREAPTQANEDFLSALEFIFKSTVELMYHQHQSLSQWTSSALWREHFEAWDLIFHYASNSMQRIYQELSLGHPQHYSGIVATLLANADMNLEHIWANSIDMTAGSVDTTVYPMLMTLFELARNPEVQQAVRQESLRAEATISADPRKVLTELPLLKGALRETLRLYPVGPFLDRELTSDTVLHNYWIPTGTKVRVALYSLGRDPTTFASPERYHPKRWLEQDTNTRLPNLAFGFGIRQCLGRRLAKTEMLLLMHHVLKNFMVETPKQEDLGMLYRFLLIPSTFPLLTIRAIN
ncbi:cytochrome P450 11B1, mitochondrial [Sorex fumeus]|uniref:cytochrome P450 11B1, mitochondrial n=1 Tax=Sorex fumeus TaxID=62283 RepID=UPI0024AE824E|nr:cytochrome P450 11B1, mitochondrial [Sorex fumeus]